MSVEAAPDLDREKPVDTTEKRQGSGTPGAVMRSGKLRFLTLADLDCRTAAYRETTRLIAEIEADLGGADQLSTGERQLVQRAGVMGALLSDIETRWIRGEPVDPAAYCTTVNAQRRVLETIGLHRRPKDVVPDLRTYLADSEAQP
jgi:hypothetical protein